MPKSPPNDYSFGERIGELFTVMAAGLSLITVSFILLFALYRWIRRRMAPRNVLQLEATDSSLFLSLMFADLIQAVGEIPTLRWMMDGHVTEGSNCQAQAGLRHFGVLGVAFSSLAIGLYTFYVLVLRRIPHKQACKFGCVVVWIVTCLVGGISSIVHSRKGETFYGPSGRYWCWIAEPWKGEKLWTSYLWMWSAAFGMLVVYGVIFLAIRGWIRIPQGGFLPQASGASTLNDEPVFKRSKRVARLMLYFPLVYIIIILPNSVTRWIEFTGTKVPYQATLFSNTMLRLSGFFNFVLFVITRPRMAFGEKLVIHQTVQHTVYPLASQAHRQSDPRHLARAPYTPSWESKSTPPTSSSW